MQKHSSVLWVKAHSLKKARRRAKDLDSQVEADTVSPLWDNWDMLFCAGCAEGCDHILQHRS